MNNFISIVKDNFFLVIYTDINSSKFININNNPNIKIILKPLKLFHNYKYKNFWIRNHSKNVYLNSMICWELNMLWSEKTWFVKETVEKNYFNTEMHGWCDIGYFRNRPDNMHTIYLKNWPNVKKLDQNKIHYACVNNDAKFIQILRQNILHKNQKGLPSIPIPPNIPSIAGGFFILHKNKIHWWTHLLDDKLQLYFNHGHLVKDDQIILADCIFSNMEYFSIHFENDKKYDNWFMFQRILNK